MFASVVFIHIVSGNPQIGWYELFCTKPFIVAIMIYYIFLYLIRKYALDKVNQILYATALISLFVYILWFPYKYEVSTRGLYGTSTYYRWIPYFAAMLFGAKVGKDRKELKCNAWGYFWKLLLCVALFYSVQLVAKIYRPIAPLQIVTLLPLMGIAIYLYKCCNSRWIKKIYDSKWGNICIMIVGGLCLESYLIQEAIFTDKMNSIWPLNLIAIVFIILLCSYFVRCVARLFSQTFRTEDYEWRNIFSIY